MQMRDKDSCRQFINELNQEYIDSHLTIQKRDLLVAENNIEKRDIKGYHGREILELLQNADDAYQKSIDLGEKPSCDLEVSISYKGNILTVSNTGTFFDDDGIKSIVQGNNSTKLGKYIGNKGTGFRSVLNWAKCIRIYSGNYNVEFSVVHAEELFNKIKDEPQIKKQLLTHPDLYIPILSVPYYLEDNPYDSHKTTIEIEVDEAKICDDYNVEKQISNIDLKILLFLPNVSKIEINTDNGTTIFQREERVDGDFAKDVGQENKVSLITLKRIENGFVRQNEDYDLHERIIYDAIKENEAYRSINSTIAVPNDSASKAEYLYTYFPLLNTKTPFGCVIHGTYDLGDHRDTINRNETNKAIIQEQLKHIVSIADYYIQQGKNEIALNILTPSNLMNTYSWKFELGFDGFGLEQTYLEMLKDVRFLKDVNGNSVSLNDGPKILLEDAPDCLKGIGFDGYVKGVGSNLLIGLLARRFGLELDCDENELEEIVNARSSSFTVSDAVETFIWWSNNYRNSLPNLLKNQDGQWIGFQKDCYFLEGEFSGIILPAWVKVPAIDVEYQKELFVQVLNNDKNKSLYENAETKSVSRLICQNNLFSSVKFMYRDRSNIVPTINSSIDTYEKSLEYLQWLWKYYGEDQNCPPKTDTPVKYKFPSNGGEICSSDALYFGNELSEKLFAGSDYKRIVDFSVVGIDDSEKENFESFLSRFGVKEYPPVEGMPVDLVAAYETIVKSVIMDTQNIASSSDISYLICNFPYVKNIVRILTGLTTHEIVRWMHSDIHLVDNLSNKYYSAESCKIVYKGNTQRTIYSFVFNTMTKVPNYLLYVFNNTKWIQFGEQKYSPKEIILDYYGKNSAKFEGLVPVVSKEYIDELAETLNITIEEVNEILKLFSFCSNVTELPSNDFYGLMLKLPEIEHYRSIEISKSIYRFIEQPDFNISFGYSENKRRFFEQGKLLTKKQEYVLAKEVYLPSTKIINKRKFNILDKGQRTNNKKFTELFGCKEFDAQITVNKNSVVVSPLNGEFLHYFEEFKRYANAYSAFNKNVEKELPLLSITLVSSIKAFINDQLVEIDENYSEIRDSANKWFIIVKDAFLDYDKMSECVENVFSNIANTPNFETGRIGELFRTKELSRRNFLISKDFGSLEVISGKTFTETIKDSFISTLKSIDDSFDVKTIAIDFLHLNEYEAEKEIVSIFNALHIRSLEEFKANGFEYDFDFTKYYAQEVLMLIANEKDNYANYLYWKAVEKGELRKGFLEECNRFENFRLDGKITEIIDVRALLVNEFGNWFERPEMPDYREKYRENYQQMNPEDLYADEIANDNEARTLIYFRMEEDFKKWLEAHTEVSPETKDKSVYAQYRDVIPQEETVSFSEPGGNRVETRRSGRTGVVTETALNKRERNKKIMGNKGELLIYNLLCDKYGKDNVFPKSEAFVALQILKPGQAVSAGCDIEYINRENNERYFVEVKSGDSNSFFISVSELEFAKEHRDHHELWVVYNFDKEIPNCRRIDLGFWENENYRAEEIIEKIHYVF